MHGCLYWKYNPNVLGLIPLTFNLEFFDTDTKCILAAYGLTSDVSFLRLLHFKIKYDENEFWGCFC